MPVLDPLSGGGSFSRGAAIMVRLGEPAGASWGGARSARDEAHFARTVAPNACPISGKAPPERWGAEFALDDPDIVLSFF